MPFQTRNPYYLRISEKNVLPLYLYLDERHLDWMSDVVLQHVLADLRPHILPKLKAEASLLGGSKKATVDTHRGDTYQFCYFIRKTEPHSVVVKTRNFVARPPQKPSMIPAPPVSSLSKPRRGKRKVESIPEKVMSENTQKKRKTKGKGRARVEEEFSTSSPDEYEAESDITQTRRSARSKKPIIGGYRGIDGEDTPVDSMEIIDQNQALDISTYPADPGTERSSTTPANDAIPIGEIGANTEHSGAPANMEVDDMLDSGTRDPSFSTIAIDLELEEETKPKPMLQLKYQGFDIYGHCLCIVVEPWPPIRLMSKAPLSLQAKAPNIVSPGTTREPNVRAKTPLFLPDDSRRERGETPAPFRGGEFPPPASLFLNPNVLDDSDDSDGGGMVEFSQVLHAAGDIRAGAVDDDEDMDNAIFFGDADEVREL